MKEKLFIFGALGLLLALLIGLSAASYVQKEKIPDSEAYPNRSTYNTGPTGTRAYHDLLKATGHNVTRWEKPVSELATDKNSGVSTLVIVGKTRREIGDDEIAQILEWVESGGRLVLIDRRPSTNFLETTSSWQIEIEDVSGGFSAAELNVLLPTVDPSNSAQMTDGEEALRSLQPSTYTLGVNAVQTSKFATSIKLERVEADYEDADSPDSTIIPPKEIGEGLESGTSREDENVPDADSESIIPAEEVLVAPGEYGNEESNSVEQEPPPVIQGPVLEEDNAVDADEVLEYSTLAPFLHLGNKQKKILADYPYGNGTIVLLSDPYIISNGGIGLVDNAQTAVNIVSGAGVIAFDEYHQGFGSNQNRLLNYFYGTPVLPVFLQLLLLTGLVMFTLSRRFARPLPVEEPNRISKLEYVGAMAQLKRSTKAFDLAVENIYTDFRRRVARLVGVDNHHTRNRDIAEAIASRTDYTLAEIVDVIEKCEDIIHGEPTNKKAVLALAVKIREIENALGLRRGRTIFRK